MGLGPLVCAASLLLIVRLSPSFSYWTDLLPAVLLFSVGLSLIVAPLTSTVLADAGPRDAGIASGINNAVARVAGLLGIAVVGLAAANKSNELSHSGFRMSMWVTGGLLAAGGVIGITGIRNR
jgi:predicted MFS family arabinose efflux permease